MIITSFDWDKWNENHIMRHNVMPYEVEETILLGDPIFKRSGDGKYLVYGLTGEGRYLFVVFVFRGKETARVITARDMSDKEKKYYKRIKR